jgi:hypothetical protein
MMLGFFQMAENRAAGNRDCGADLGPRDVPSGLLSGEEKRAVTAADVKQPARSAGGAGNQPLPPDEKSAVSSQPFPNCVPVAPMQFTA